MIKIEKKLPLKDPISLEENDIFADAATAGNN
jgi:hypothetical protein